MQIQLCNSFIDYLGEKAYKESDYKPNLCCYLSKISFDVLPKFLEDGAKAESYDDLTYYFVNQGKFVKDSNGELAAARIQGNAILSESDTEPDDMVNYQQLFNECVSANFSKSGWFRDTWNSYNSTETIVYPDGTGGTTSGYYGDYQKTMYLMNSGLSSGYEASAYNIYDVKTDPIIHDTAVLTVDDAIFDNPNQYPFNSALICINRNFSRTDVPTNTCIPVAVIDFSHDILLNAKQASIEHSELGLVRVK